MEDYTIAEDYVLPSLGKVYDKAVNPNVKIRSMTTEEEMKRLGHTDKPRKLLAEIIDDCLVEKPGVSSYDLCIGDFQYLMHKLRIVTYGSDYLMQTRCPLCGQWQEQTINLEQLKVSSFNEKLKSYLNITLPVSKKKIEIKLQTPRMLDEIELQKKELLKKSSDKEIEPAVLFTVESLISKVDGQVLEDFKLEQLVRKLPMKDTNYILQSARKINIGLDTLMHCECKNCHTEYDCQLPITGEFFGPSIN